MSTSHPPRRDGLTVTLIACSFGDGARLRQASEGGDHVAQPSADVLQEIALFLRGIWDINTPPSNRIARMRGSQRQPQHRVPFVGREPELARLGDLLERALTGNGQVCFIAGEPGAGKTALLQEFTRRAQANHPELIITVGDCSTTGAASDAYLPFREIFELLTGDVDAGVAHGAITVENGRRLRTVVERTAEIVADYGIDLVEVFIPGAALTARLGGALAKRVGLATGATAVPPRPSTLGDSARVMQQFTNVVRKVAEARPLVLVIDDVHWADRASLDLLFHLSRRIERSQLLILATYRANEIAAVRSGERHPLVPVINEIQRYYGDTMIDLDSDDAAARRSFVNNLVDAESNTFPATFRDELFSHTQGQPLFTVELLCVLRERGMITPDAAGRWGLVGTVQWDILPKRSEGVIAERLGRVPPDVRDLLSIASVEGEQFTAQVVAQVAGSTARTIVRALSDIAEREHQLVRAQGIQKVGVERVVAYRFRHELFRVYLYNSLDAVQRGEMHFLVARALEQLYTADLETIAPVLADHFYNASELETAIRYLNVSADAAMRRHAPRQAAALWQRALTSCRASGTPVAERLDMLEKRGDALRLCGAFDEARTSLHDALESAEQPLSRARLLRKIGGCLADQQHVHEALDQFERAETELLRHPEDADLVSERVQLLLDRAWALYLKNAVAEMKQLLADGDGYVSRYGTTDDQARWLEKHVLVRLRVERYRPSPELRELAVRLRDAASGRAHDTTWAMCAFLHGFVHLWRADLETAKRSLTEALQVGHQHAYGLIIVLAHTYLTVLSRLLGDVEDVVVSAGLAETAALEFNMTTYVAAARANRAWAQYRRGDFGDVEPLTRAALDVWHRAEIGYPFKWLGVWTLAAVLLERDATHDALEAIELALHPTQQPPPAQMAAEVGAARAALDNGNTAAAHAHLQRVLGMARAAGEL